MEMKDAPRGAWQLVRAFNKVQNLDELKRVHERNQSKKKKGERILFVYPTTDIAEKCGYIVWQDSKIVVFYTNTLALTPPDNIISGNTNEAVKCVNGLAKLSRWFGSETMTPTVMKVPAPIVAYNQYMNAVDRLDQLRSTNATKRCEK